MKEVCLVDLPKYQQWLAVVLVMLIERWFGKTKLFAAGSMLEAVENIFKRKPKDPKNGT